MTEVAAAVVVVIVDVNVLGGYRLLWQIISVWHKCQLFYGIDDRIPKPSFEFD